MQPTGLPMTRRRFVAGAGAFLTAGILPRSAVRAEIRPANQNGFVIGEPFVEAVGTAILAQGGNAVDALVATALAGAVTQPHQTGIGGYGAHGVFAMNGGTRVVAIDANSTAPAAFTRDFFRPDANGKVPNNQNDHGWLATGVPGVIAGLKLALDQFGTMSFTDVLQPAILLARDGFRVSKSLSGVFTHFAAALQKDPGSAKLYLTNGKAPEPGSTWRNPELAELLMTLAGANSIEPFYRGEIADHIVTAFAQNGGLVTRQDMAAYQARLVEPLTLTLGEHTVHTAPLTSGGISVLQMLNMLKAMQWEKMPAGLSRTHARVEAMRLAWRDRVTLLGDPDAGPVPQDRLLSNDYAAACAEEILAVVKAGRFIDHGLDSKPQGGTLNFSACDQHGNIAAMTITHGNAFGAQVTVDGLGLTLGHGMSRFDLQPDHPNSPGPAKRPLNNMTPCIVTHAGRPVVAIGGAGGRRIPNALFEFLTQYLLERHGFVSAMKSPRIHTEGTSTLEFQKSWPAEETSALAQFGYTVKNGPSAVLGGVGLENDQWHAVMQ